MTISFTKWEERLAVADTVPTRIRYTHTNMLTDERQVTAHDQQNDAADREWGQIDRTWLWQDNFTGTTFNRPQFQNLLSFCRANPQPRHSPARIEMDAPSRFGRILDEDKQLDVLAYHQLYSELTKLGWVPTFASLKLSGNSLTDTIALVLNAQMDMRNSNVLPTTLQNDCGGERTRGQRFEQISSRDLREHEL